jgi:hypothetical protein
MAEAKFRQVGEERLSETEIAALRARFDEESQEAVTLSALAEAAGLDRETVREHLRQIRTEQAFRAAATPPKSSDRPNWYWAVVGGVALVVAGAITFRRLEAARLVDYVPSKPQATQTTPLTSSTPVRTVKQPTMLPLYSDGLVGHAPLGIETLIAIPDRQQSSSGRVGNVTPGSFEEQRDMILHSIEEMVKKSHEEVAKYPKTMPQFRAKPPFMDTHLNTFTLKPGQFHYAVKGWAGRLTGELNYPLSAADRVKLRKQIDQMFADERIAQEKALGPAPRQGVVTPPPGYRIRFGGRRLDDQIGPKLAFAPVPVVLVQRRLEAALENAIKRDVAPPEGRWTENAQRERKIPAPKQYAGSIDGPGGTIPYDFPASPPSAVKRGIRDVAARAAAQMADVNAHSGDVVRVQLDGTVRN